MMATFAPVLLEHLYHPRYSSAGQTDAKGIRSSRCGRYGFRSAHLEMLHFIVLVQRTKFGSATASNCLQALSRACGWLFRETQRPGNGHHGCDAGVVGGLHVSVGHIRQGILVPARLVEHKGGRTRGRRRPKRERQSISTSSTRIRAGRTRADLRVQRSAEGRRSSRLESSERRTEDATEELLGDGRSRKTQCT